MGKEPIQTPSKEKSSQSHEKISNGGGSALVLILAIVSVIAIGLYIFKDKIFKNKPKDLSDLKQDPPKEEPPVEQKPEVLKGDDAKEAESKFAKL